VICRLPPLLFAEKHITIAKEKQKERSIAKKEVEEVSAYD